MALHWDITKVKDAWREISKEEYESGSEKLIIMFQCTRYYDESKDKYYEMHVECNMLIFICGMFSGIPIITKDNYERLTERIDFLESINKATYLTEVNPKTKEKKEFPITAELVKKYIGLETNGNKLTRSQFISQSTKGWKL